MEPLGHGNYEGHEAFSAAASDSGAALDNVYDSAAHSLAAGGETPAAFPAAAVGEAAAAAVQAPATVRPILRGRILAIPGSPGQYAFEGFWAMQESDRLWSQFRYVLKTPPHPPAYLHKADTIPLHPAFPSAAEHQTVGCSMSGYFLIQDTTVNKIAEKDVRMKVGGGPFDPSSTGAPDRVYEHWKPPSPLLSSTGIALPVTEQPALSEAEQLSQCSDAEGGLASPFPLHQLVPFNGEGSNPYGKFRFAGAYHAVTGVAWARKIYLPRSGASSTAGGSVGGSSDKKKRESTITAGIAPAVPMPARRNNLSAEQTLMVQSLKSIKLDRQNSQFFLAPVDPVALNIPDYPVIITQPMDLGTVEAKIYSGAYSNSLDDFNRDIQLTFQNAIRYNGPEHPVAKCAAMLLERFKEECSRRQERKERMSMRADEVSSRAQKSRVSYGLGDSETEDEARRKSLGGAAKPRKSVPGGGAVGAGVKRARDSEDEDGAGRKSAGGGLPKKPRPAAPVGTAGALGAAVGAAGEGLGTNPELLQLIAKAITEQVMTSLGSGVASGAVVNSLLQKIPGQIQSQAAGMAGAAAGKKKDASRRTSGSGVNGVPAGGSRSRPAGGSSQPVAAARPPSMQVQGGLVVLSNSEKIELKEQAARLTEEQSHGLVQIIQERMPLDQTGGEVELDLDNMDTPTLRHMQVYIAECLGMPAPKAAIDAVNLLQRQSASRAGGGSGANSLLAEVRGLRPSLGGVPAPSAPEEDEDDIPPPPSY